jgi:hypothetical protein
MTAAQPFRSQADALDIKRVECERSARRVDPAGPTMFISPGNCRNPTWTSSEAELFLGRFLGD